VKRLSLGDLCPRWEGKLPGTPVPCGSKVVGRRLTLGKGKRRESVTVTGCAVPPLPSPRKRARGSKGNCSRGFMVEGLPGVTWAVPASVVRNATRTPRRLDREFDQVVPGSGEVEALFRANTRAGLPAVSGLDLPYPHRAGSTPCCRESADYHGRLRELLDAVEDGRADHVELEAATRRALPRGERGRSLDTTREVEAAIQAVEGHCETLWRHWDDQHGARADRASAGARGARTRRELARAEGTGDATELVDALERVEQDARDRASASSSRRRSGGVKRHRAGG